MARLLTALLPLLAACIGPVCAAAINYELPEDTATLAPGPNEDQAQGMCGGCHSVDYITTQPRNVASPRAFWAAEVSKMQHSYGAPIDDETAKAIVDYLAATYGNQ
jgi:hypothetical protein